MRIFKIIFFTALLYSFVSDAQIGDDEYNKYWYYRQRLITEFMVPGVEDHGCSASEMDIPNGYSLPAELTYGGTTSGLDGGKKMIRFADATAYLGYYIAVLATEHKLLKDAGWSTEQTDKELYWAMRAFERLDKYSAIWYWEDFSCYENGFFIRDDVDGSRFNKNPVFERYKVGGEYNFMSDYIETNHKSRRDKAVITNDQITHLFEGLALVKALFSNSENYNGYYFRSSAINIADRIVRYLNNNYWEVRDDKDNGYKFDLQYIFIAEGHGIYTAKAASFITGTSAKVYLSKLSFFKMRQMEFWARVNYNLVKTKGIISTGNEDFIYTHLISSMAIGNTYNQSSTDDILNKSDDWFDIGYYKYLNSVLRNRTSGVANTKYQNELLNAPCYGITWRPANSAITSNHPYYQGVNNWRARNRWIRFAERIGKNEFPHFKGNGLDYMILYNLYLLYNKSRNPNLVGNLPNRPPGFHLNIETPTTLAYDLVSYNNINLSSTISFSNTNVRYITANDKITLSTGFKYRAQTNQKLVISARGKVNACGHPIDEYGEPIGSFPVPRIAESSAIERERSVEYQHPTSGKVEENSTSNLAYTPLDEYLNVRNSSHKEAFILKISTYPNPSDNKNLKLILKSNNQQNVSITLVDIKGEMVLNFGDYELNNMHQELNLTIDDRVKPGVYFINVASHENKQVLKQIIL